MSACPAWLAPCLLLLAVAGCQSCPPAWVDSVPEKDGWLYAVGTAHEVFVEADARNLALTRAARRLVDSLGLDAERRLSVAFLDGQPFVEAVGPDGPFDDLDGLQLVDVAVCASRTHVLVRIAQNGR